MNKYVRTVIQSIWECIGVLGDQKMTEDILGNRRTEGGYRIIICTAYSNKEHLYSKISPRARKIYITTLSNQGVLYPFNETLPTPPEQGGSMGSKQGGLPHKKRGAITPPIKPFVSCICLKQL